ncbi:MAG: EAL domain-containing protein [Gammaproteobacteria bacterium]|nr:EAL domain-containing protein [Gammaproteobacteria bacterium]MDH5801815.1 EAL domain-containing protein [Gammaproteobacteria bacterium]
MKANDIRQRLILGFGSTLLLILVLQLLGLTGMDSIQENLRQGNASHNERMALISALRLAENESAGQLYRLLSVEESSHEQELSQYKRHRHQFQQYRHSLENSGLPPRHNALVEQIIKHSEEVSRLEEQVLEKVLAGDLENAKKQLFGATVNSRQEVILALERLEKAQTDLNQLNLQHVNNTYQKMRELLFWISVAVVLLAGAIAVFVVKRTVKFEASLFREKEQAHVTLDSIGEGVISTDDNGLIRFMNKAAEHMTGWTLEQAWGNALLQVFCIKPESDSELPAENPVVKAMVEAHIVNSNQRIRLLKENGDEYAIEYTAAPMMDPDRSITGAVLVFRDLTAVRGMADRLAFQATHDSLTQLINRREFEARLEQALKLCRQSEQHHVLAYMDLDLFKVVNDTCGHMAGDELLKQISGLLHEKIRKTDTLARLGGDEFGILFLRCPLKKALEIIEVLRKAVKQYRFVWGDKSFEIGASIGLVEVSSASGGIAEILSAADTACFVAKDLGRNRYHIYQPGDVELAARRTEMLWMPRIQQALKSGDFELFYQRIQKTSHSNDDPDCREILLRMIDENGHFIPPRTFLHAAERYDLMPDIDRWVVASAFSKISALKQDHQCLWMINLSGQTLCDGRFYDYVIQKKLEFEVEPTSICFEITETAAVANLSSAKEMMSKLKQQGFRFALDDFGSGLSSFNYLKNLPVEFLKIDGSFVQDMLADPISTAMVESINQIGHVMGLKTIAEFVEDNVTMYKLKRMQIDYLQGYGLHKPEPLNQYTVAVVPSKSLELV